MIAHLGHATLLANLGGQHILVDPWFPPASAADASPPPALIALPPLAGVFITHHHWDHVHSDTLLRLDKTIPVYIPRQDPGRALSPRTEELLRYLGFRAVQQLEHGAAIPVGDGGEVVATPFFGEDPTQIGYRGNCYVLRHGGAAALVHVDSGTDLDGHSMLDTGVAAALVAQFGALDRCSRRADKSVES